MIALLPEREIFVVLGPLVIRWYGALYVVAFWLGWVLWPYFLKRRGVPLSSDDRLFIFAAALVGLMVGGRLGYAVLYEPHFFLSHPLEIFALWRGGMASHGGMIGGFLGIWWASRRKRIPVLAVLDSLIVPVSLGLALGRIGNFINQELYGTVTSLPWGVRVPNVDGPRHPVQLYAAAKDLALGGATWLTFVTRRRAPAGTATTLFLMGYGALRFLIEFVRQPEYPLLPMGALALTRGQLFSLPLIVGGLLLGWYLYSYRPAAPAPEGPSR